MTHEILQKYIPIVGEDIIHQLIQLSASLKNFKIVHINSTKEGGGVAEILAKMVPLSQALGLNTSWEVIEGDNDFFHCTKSFHNGLQGDQLILSLDQLRHYKRTNEENAARLQATLVDADIVIIHDPQPLSLIDHTPKGNAKWIWRCHIDASRPHPPIWSYLEQFVRKYDAAIFSLAAFAQPLPLPTYIIAPSIDPLSEKNMELNQKEIRAPFDLFGIDPSRPTLLQVSRFDRFKDPLGVIESYKLAKKFHPELQLVFAGALAGDDPEGEEVLAEILRNKGDDPDIFILKLPSDANLTINALQRAATVVLQKSLKEGFGLTVTEALWKAKPVIGGNVGGIRLQIVDHQTGFLVNTPEGASNRIRYYLHNSDEAKAIGSRGRTFVREKFLITRHLRDYLSLFASLYFHDGDQIELTNIPRT